MPSLIATEVVPETLATVEFNGEIVIVPPSGDK